jgi:bifunctional DNA-binding transcriptional regulator/antitoxin component of YhaV-PrlF toxin-antitoxin module
MLAKLTRGNQFTIPKPIVERARLRAGRDYLDVAYLHGVIVLKPVDVEERIPPEAYERFIKDVLTIRPGDIVADERTADNVLKRRMKKR